MKIAHINSGIRGLASYALNIFNYFERTDIETLIVSETKWHKQPIKCFEPDSTLLGGILPWAHRPGQVLEKLKEFNPDILHHHHPCGRLDFSIGKLQRQLDIPLVCTYHMSVGSKKYMIDKVMNAFYMMVRKQFLNADCHVAISHYVRDQLYKIAGVPKEKIVTLYAGVDPEVFKPAPFENHDELNVTFVGEITREKGVDGLINVVHELAQTRKIKLNLVGKGRSRDALVRKTKNWPEINWVGFLKGQAEVAKFLSRSDVVCLPNRWDEAFSYIPLEAMSCGTAMIAARIGGNPEAIEDGKSGFLFEPGNFKELYALLEKADIQQLRDMGEKGRERVLSHFTLEQFGRKYESLYRNLLEDRHNLRQID
jgi:glycosyltransferase involved in cell wall biosynthesis